MAQEREQAKTTEKPTTNVIDVTAQFSKQRAKATETKTPDATKSDMSDKSDTSKDNDDGTIYENE